MWEHGQQEFQRFLKALSCYHPTITLATEYSMAELNLLDVTVSKKGNQLVHDLYVKPTDTPQYLHANSCHVRSLQKVSTFQASLAS